MKFPTLFLAVFRYYSVTGLICVMVSQRLTPDFHHSVAFSPFPLAVSVHGTPLHLHSKPTEFDGNRFPWLVGVDDWLENNGKSRTRTYFNRRTVTAPLCRLRLFLRNFYRTTEIYNGRTVKRQRNGENRASECKCCWQIIMNYRSVCAQTGRLVTSTATPKSKSTILKSPSPL